MALTNAENQKRWRERRNALAEAGTPKEIADGILRQLGAEKAAKVERALKARLRKLRPDCPNCQGTGFVKLEARTACNRPLGSGPITMPCGCDGSEILPFSSPPTPW